MWFLVEDDVAAVMNGEMKMKVKTTNLALVVLQQLFFFNKPAASHGDSALSEVWVTNGPSYTNFEFLVAHIPGFPHFTL